MSDGAFLLDSAGPATDRAAAPASGGVTREREHTSSHGRSVRNSDIACSVIAGLAAFVLTRPAVLLLSLLITRTSQQWIAPERLTVLFSGLAVVGLTLWIRPLFCRPMVGRIRLGRVWRMIPRGSVADYLVVTRITIGFLACSVLLTDILHAAMLRITDPPVGTLSSWGSTTLCMACSVLGVAVIVCYRRIFQASRGRHITRWHRHRASGLAVLDYAPDWDHPGKPMFDGCRGSQRIADAYQITCIAAATCFAAAACFASQLVAHHWAMEIMVFAGIIAALSLWPTPGRLGEWCIRTAKGKRARQ